MLLRYALLHIFSQIILLHISRENSFFPLKNLMEKKENRNKSVIKDEEVRMWYWDNRIQGWYLLSQ